MSARLRGDCRRVRYLSVAEFAAATGVKADTVQKRCQRGVYRCRPHKPGEHWRVLRSELERVLRETEGR